MPEKEPELDLFDHDLVASIVKKIGEDAKGESKVPPLLSFAELDQKLTAAEAAEVAKLLALNPTRFGFKGPKVSFEDPPDNLVAIEGQRFSRDGATHVINPQYLPQPAWAAFQEMQAAIQADLGSRLMVESGYRSPAAQAIVFFYWNRRHGFDVARTARGVALPGYSQHGDPRHTAVDVMNQDGVPDDENPEDFEHTKEYEWLRQNAGRYKFHLSYPEPDNDGIQFEPWHWRFIG